MSAFVVWGLVLTTLRSDYSVCCYGWSTNSTALITSDVAGLSGSLWPKPLGVRLATGYVGKI